MTAGTQRCGLVLDPVFRLHQTPAGHPERPDRLLVLEQAIGQWEFFPSLSIVPPTKLAEEWLSWVHVPEMVSLVQATRGRPHVAIDPDTHTSTESYRVATLAAGSLIELIRRVLERELERGFALIRPPGHHAESRRAMGFCLFNNVALGAEYALRNYSRIRRVAIVDFDVHHGNGTQEIFYHRSDVLYLSSHQMPLFPGTGNWQEQGISDGLGFTVNFPLLSGIGDQLFVPLYQQLATRLIEQFEPDLLLVSAGFDAHQRDPLASLQVSSTGFGKVVSSLQALAEALKIPLICVLEGGYDLTALSESVLASLGALLNEGVREGGTTAEFEQYRREAVSQLSDRWGEVNASAESRRRREFAGEFCLDPENGAHESPTSISGFKTRLSLRTLCASATLRLHLSCRLAELLLQHLGQPVNRVALFALEKNQLRVATEFGLDLSSQILIDLIVIGRERIVALQTTMAILPLFILFSAYNLSGQEFLDHLTPPSAIDTPAWRGLATTSPTDRC